jgi:hypothetical protein
MSRESFHSASGGRKVKFAGDQSLPVVFTTEPDGSESESEKPRIAMLCVLFFSKLSTELTHLHLVIFLIDLPLFDMLPQILL